MTLLASERSMLIRSKFRSVLQLRMQHRRSQEQHLLTPLTKPPPTYLEVNGTPEQSRANETLKVKVQTRTHKLGAAKGQFTEDEDLSSSSSSSSSSSPCLTPCLGGPPGNPSPPSASGAAVQPELLSILESLPPSVPVPDPNSQPPAGGPPAKAPASLPKGSE
ncbi:Myocardin [Chelonia mydas]|uniref:Myocardin n=1 Tax=Chelonia mydas TaxID=8469 RepID=M7AVQ1_CHEMY|nr:Myocardin [Chelonia mydas]